MSRLALCLIVQEIGGPIDPGFGNIGGIGGIGGGHPSQGLPWGPGHPSQGLPGSPGHPSQGLPGSPGHPSQGLPGAGGLPTHPIWRPEGGTKPTPPGQSPGAGLWVVAYVPNKGFQWVAITPGVPEKPVPGEPPSPDQGLPQPPTATPKG